MDMHERAIADLRKSIARLLFLKFALAGAVAWLFLWGSAVVVLRAAAGMERIWLLWGLAGAGPAILIAVILSRGRVPTPSAVRAMLDGRSKAGGLLMAAEQTDLGPWQQRLPSPATLGLHFRGRKVLVLLGAAALFVAVGFAVPQRFAAMDLAHGLQVGEEIDRLAAQIETLKEEEIIDVEKAEALEDKLDEIRATASGEDPVKTWEALDHIESQTAKIAREAAEEALAQTEKLTQTEALAEGLKQDLDKLDPKAATEAMKELAEMTRQAGAECDGLEEALSDELQEACQGGALTPEQLQELAETLGQCKGELAETLKELCEAGLIDVELVELCEALGECDSAGLADFLDEHGQEGMSAGELVNVWCRGRPGRGGITRGRGDAPMTWTDGTDPQGAKFKEKVLPPASIAGLKESRLAGVSAAAPDASGSGSDSGRGALAGAAAGAGAAHTHTILPRHRGAVGRYFERKEK